MASGADAPDSLDVQCWMLDVGCFPLSVPPDENGNFIHAHARVVRRRRETRGGIVARRRSRRAADGNGLWPRGQRAGRKSRRQNFPNQRPAGAQSHHRPRRQQWKWRSAAWRNGRRSRTNSPKHSGPARSRWFCRARRKFPTSSRRAGATVGVRWPSHPFIQAVIRECGFPLAAPSANLSNQISPTNAEHVRAQLGGKISLIVDGGQSQVGIESTVLDLTVSPPPNFAAGNDSRGIARGGGGKHPTSNIQHPTSNAAESGLVEKTLFAKSEAGCLELAR